MIIKMDYENSVFESIEFNTRVSFLCGNSASGKSYLLKMLKVYLEDNDIGCYLYSDSKELNISTLPKDVDFILLDRADLYMNKELWGYILRDKNRKYIICLRYNEGYRSNLLNEVGSYTVGFKGGRFFVRRYI